MQKRIEIAGYIRIWILQQSKKSDKIVGQFDSMTYELGQSTLPSKYIRCLKLVAIKFRFSEKATKI